MIQRRNKMGKGFEEIEEMEYPGRIVGFLRTIRGEDCVLYGLTGRSESSQARRLDADDERVYTEVTDEKVFEKGDPALLLYNAVRFHGDRTIVTNGAQSDLLFNTMELTERVNGTEVPTYNVMDAAFSRPFHQWKRDGTPIDLASYEPDPLKTPRISGILENGTAYLSIVKPNLYSDGLEPMVKTTRLGITLGKGMFMATYDGPNPEDGNVPQFWGGPRDIEVPRDVGGVSTHQDIADRLFDSLGEFAVSAACVIPSKRYSPTGELNPPNHYVGIKNLHD